MIIYAVLFISLSKNRKGANAKIDSRNAYVTLLYFLSSEVIICLHLNFQIWIKLCRYFKLQNLLPFAEFSFFYGICDIAFWLINLRMQIGFYFLSVSHKNLRPIPSKLQSTPPKKNSKKPPLNTKNECPSLVPLSQYRHIIHPQRCVQ